MLNVFLAEDNPADVYLIREALEEHGVKCNLRVASDGKQVLGILSAETAEQQDYRLIILDLNLPRHDGIEILEYLRKSKLFSRVPVVVLTSSDSPQDRLLATNLGAQRYLRKPSNLEQFMSLGAEFKKLLESGNVEGASK